MMRDPWSNEQLRFVRQLQEPIAFERPKSRIITKLAWVAVVLALIAVMAV
jgi:hypothetical protein